MSEALNFFLDEARICDVTANPDEGIDYAFMLDESEWAVLLEQWDDRSEQWKSCVTYLAGFRPLSVNKAIVMKAIQEEDEDVFEEGLLALYQSLAAEIDETGAVAINLSAAEREIAVEQLDNSSDAFKTYPEYEELIALLDA